MARIPLTRPVLGDEELERIRAVLSTGMLVQGAQVAAFEAGLGERLLGRRVACVSSGTTALHLAFEALGVGPGDEVVLPDFCFPSVAAAVLHTGAVPVLCDVDPDTFNLDRRRVEQGLSVKTRAVVAVHQFGLACGAAAIERDLGIPVVEDAACALGAREEGEPCGARTTIGCASFHPRKIITTAEGGAIITADPELDRKVRALRSHGMERRDGGVHFAIPGFAGRMSEVHAAIGLAQLDRMDGIIAGRARSAQLYRAPLQALPGVAHTPDLWDPDRVWQGLVVRLTPEHDRDRVVAMLKERGIESTVGTYAIHRLEAFGHRCRVAAGGLAGSCSAADEGLTLPLWPDMPAATVERVVDALAAVQGETR